MPALLRLASALLFLALILGGCGPSRQQVRQTGYMDSPEAQQATLLFNNQQYGQAAPAYRKLADHAPQNLRDHLLLMSADSYRLDRQLQEAGNLLPLINKAGLNADGQLKLRVIAAEYALASNQPEEAMQLTETPPEAQSQFEARQAFFSVRAQAAQSTANRLEQSLALEQLETLQIDPSKRLQTQLDILKTLSGTTNSPGQPQTSLHLGWLELAGIYRDLRSDPQSLDSSIQEWRKLYPTHPALNGLTQAYLDQQGALNINVNKLAILLPITGKHAGSAQAIRDGIMTAWYAQQAADRPELAFYDSAATQDMNELVARATKDGASLIIGPLLKESVDRIAQVPYLPVPILALNEVQQASATPPNLYQFALSPVDEAVQAADWAWSNELRTPALLGQSGARTDRLFQAFEQRWHELGGGEIINAEYEPNYKSISATLQNLLGIDESKKRHQRMQRILGRNLEFTPSRSNHMDFIFATGDEAQLMQIMPLLIFHYAEDIRVLGTSAAWVGGLAATPNADLKGLNVPEIPWLVSAATAAIRYDQASVDFRSAADFPRLFAMGMDVYALFSQIKRMDNDKQEYVQGATGVLHMNDKRQIRRQLNWIKLDQPPSLLGQTPWLEAGTGSSAQTLGDTGNSDAEQ